MNAVAAAASVSPRRSSWFVAVALLSAAGLLAAGVVALWRAAHDSEELALDQMRRYAFLAAETLRQRLESPQLANAVELSRRFEIKEGALVVPEWLGWIERPPEERPELLIPMHALELTSAGQFDDALATPGLDERARGWIELAAGWSASRRGDAAVRDEWLDRLIERQVIAAGETSEPAGPSPRSSYRQVIAGTILLVASAGRELSSEWLRFGAGLLPRATRDALFSEIDERGWLSPWRGLPPELFEEQRSESDVARHVHANVRPLVPRLAQLEHGAVVVEALDVVPLDEFESDQEVLAWWSTAPGSGHGILAPPNELMRSLQQCGDANGGLGGPLLRPGVSLCLGAGTPPGAVLIAPGISLRPELWQVTRPSWMSGPVGIAVLLLVLAITGSVGCYLALRAVRREAAFTQARADFLTSVTHELKTPLASIRLFAEMLLEGRVASEEKRDEYHRLLAGESERLSALIENVLDLGRLEKGERALDRRELPLAPLVREVVERFAPLAERDGMEVRASLPTDDRVGSDPWLAYVDRGALTQVLLNLLDNARKYARAGKRIDVELARAGAGRGDREDATTSRSTARLTVRDFGPGVPMNERATIFEPFVRGAREHDGATPGIGLGLHLARNLLRAHGGGLECLAPSDGGAGACFVATLPLVANAIEPAASGATAVVAGRSGVGRIDEEAAR